MILVSERPDWHALAECRAYPIDWWFPVSEFAHGREQRQAIAICAECPVVDECLRYALDHRELDHGIWGGTLPVERRRLLRRGRTA